MFNLKDVVDLAKAGYSVKDVKELIELSKTSAEPQAEAQPMQTDTEQAQTDTEQAQTHESAAPEKPAENVPKESTQPADEPDYKALYEAEKEKVSALQNKNNKTDISQNTTVNESDLLEAIRSFC